MDRDVVIERAIQRTRRYWYDDGLTEMAGGALFVLVGLLLSAEATGLLGPQGAGVSSLGIVVIVLGGGWLGRRAVALAKERLTYRRTGYVSYPRGARSRRAAPAIVGAGMGALVAFLFVTAPASQALIPALQGLLIGGALLYFGHTLGLGRFVALAAFSALAGAACSLAGLGDLLGSGVYFGAVGLAMAGSGSLALAAYLRQTRSPVAGEA